MQVQIGRMDGHRAPLTYARTYFSEMSRVKQQINSENHTVPGIQYVLVASCCLYLPGRHYRVLVLKYQYSYDTSS